MTTISINEFNTLISRPDWHTTQRYEIMGESVKEVSIWDEETNCDDLIYLPNLLGYVTKTSTLGEISISFTEYFNYIEHDPDSLIIEHEARSRHTWIVENLLVLDEEGDEIEALALDEEEHLPTEFSRIDYSFLKKNESQIDIDIDESSSMLTHTLHLSNASDIRFTGELIAFVEIPGNGIMNMTDTGRWTYLELYRTLGGKFICYQDMHSRWQGEPSRNNGRVCDTLENVKAYFGSRWFALRFLRECWD